jgi:hypothetical protein
VRAQTGQDQSDTEEMPEQEPLVHLPAPFHLAITGHIRARRAPGGASSFFRLWQIGPLQESCDW